MVCAACNKHLTAAHSESKKHKGYLTDINEAWQKIQPALSGRLMFVDICCTGQRRRGNGKGDNFSLDLDLYLKNGRLGFLVSGVFFTTFTRLFEASGHVDLAPKRTARSRLFADLGASAKSPLWTSRECTGASSSSSSSNSNSSISCSACRVCRVGSYLCLGN